MYSVDFVRGASPSPLSLFWRFIGKSREENFVTGLKKNILKLEIAIERPQ